MSTALEVALFLASVAVVILVGCLIPFLFQLRKNVEEMKRATDDLGSELKPLVQETRTLVQNLNQISTRAQDQMDEVEHVVKTVRAWSERADRVVGEVASAVEPPLLNAARNVKAFRKGFSVFLDFLMHRNNQTKRTQEEKHVRE